MIRRAAPTETNMIKRPIAERKRRKKAPALDIPALVNDTMRRFPKTMELLAERNEEGRS